MPIKFKNFIFQKIIAVGLKYHPFITLFFVFLESDPERGFS
jgi:hypothetical protein